MIGVDAPGVLVGAVLLGLVHGIEPGHGWPVAAAYAMDRSNAWGAGLAASLLIGIGHLISSIAVVAAYFYAIAYFDLTRLDEPILVAGVEIGGPLGIVAGLLLIGLGLREYYGDGHSHATNLHGDDNEHHERDAEGHPDHEGRDHGHPAPGDDTGHANSTDHANDPEHGHSHDAGSDADAGRFERLRSVLPVGGHQHPDEQTAQDRGLLGIAWVAFVLGFAHEEEFEIIALCTGSTHCLELMLAYAVTVVAGIVALTLLLVAGYQHFEQRVERIVPYLPAFSAAVLIVMGLGFVLGLL